MLPVILAIGAVGGLVAYAVRATIEPSKKPFRERKKLEMLKALGTLDIDGAEDGLVLARRYNDVNAQKHFAEAVRSLRSKRAPI